MTAAQQTVLPRNESFWQTCHRLQVTETQNPENSMLVSDIWYNHRFSDSCASNHFLHWMSPLLHSWPLQLWMSTVDVQLRVSLQPTGSRGLRHELSECPRKESLSGSDFSLDVQVFLGNLDRLDRGSVKETLGPFCIRHPSLPAALYLSWKLKIFLSAASCHINYDGI